MVDPEPILTQTGRRRSAGTSTLAWLGLAFALVSAGIATFGIVVVNSGRSNAEDHGFLTDFIASAMGPPVMAISIFSLALGFITMFSHRRHGMSLAVPYIIQGLSAYAIVACAAFHR
ncbi:MAG TPA: hypothetical protein VFS19_01785 [Planctomycetota bacterium]|nr:hypothetical protein [Planctomycetota bacterium]